MCQKMNINTFGIKAFGKIVENRKAMYDADVDDEGWLDCRGRGEDPTVNRPENLAVQITGK